MSIDAEKLTLFLDEYFGGDESLDFDNADLAKAIAEWHEEEQLPINQMIAEHIEKCSKLMDDTIEQTREKYPDLFASPHRKVTE